VETQTMNQDLQLVIDQMDDFSLQGVPYFFLIDFEMQKPIFYTLDSLPKDIWIETPLYSTPHQASHKKDPIVLNPNPINFSDYRKGFDKVMAGIKYGNSYLTNLTYRTELLNFDHDLSDIFSLAKANYKLKYRDEFVVFSPEPFVTIDHDIISTFPMKGTRQAKSIMDGKYLLEDKKEQAEHATIVDLMRNDLSQVARSVKVEDYRYFEIIKSKSSDLFQTSSKITGELTDAFRQKYGSLISSLLPAGSVSGAPKSKTLEIIKSAEQRPRGYYTGVFGIFDGRQLHSSVLIRFIEKDHDRFFFRSGGGLTSQSNCYDEYQELIQKIYVPIH